MGHLGTVVIYFLIVLTVLVFVHELGHYLVARWNRVKVEVFSIGFGPELFGWYDRAGTRWKFSAIPLGGYVKMFGDADPASMPGAGLPEMSEAEKAVAFHHKRLGQRVAIVAAGPIANFILAVVLMAALFMTAGQPFTIPEVFKVQPGSAAEEAGIHPGDLVVAIDGRPIERFEELVHAAQLNIGGPMALTVKSDGAERTVTVTPKIIETTDHLGNKHQTARLGIEANHREFIQRDPLSATWRAADETLNQTVGTLQAIGQMIIGARPPEIGGPLSIAQMSGEAATGGIAVLIGFMAMLSINLGLINLFPIPVLDGGHLLFYAAEAVRGRPLGPRAQEYGFRLGLALVLTLMVFATWNDLVHVGFIERLVKLVS